MLRKKWLVTIVSVLMLFAFMPISSFALSEGEAEEQAPAPEPEKVVEKVIETEAPAQENVAEEETPAVEESEVEATSTLQVKKQSAAHYTLHVTIPGKARYNNDNSGNVYVWYDKSKKAADWNFNAIKGLIEKEHSDIIVTGLTKVKENGNHTSIFFNATVIPAKCNVTFVMHGHGTAPEAQTVVNGNTAARPADPSAENWKFDGWYTDGTYSTEYDFSKPVTNHTTIHAKWSPEESGSETETTHTVKFNANGYGTAPESQTVKHNETATEPDALEAEGFEFGGWYTEATCENKYNFNSAVTEDIELFAKWTPVDNGSELIEEPTPVPPGPGPNGGGGNLVANGGGAAAAVANAAIGGYSLTEIPSDATPLANSLLDSDCCILHLIMMLLALIALFCYTSDMKRRQAKIQELEMILDEE